jgi:hypothetical protein
MQISEPSGPEFVLDQHRLGGIYERLGNTERARYWYARFLHDWRDADPGIPEVEDAKRRLAALGGPLPEIGAPQAETGASPPEGSRERR